MSLLESTSLAESSFENLTGGLTKPVVGFEALLFASEEVERIRGLRGGDVLKGGDFARRELRQSLAEIPCSVVHLASHAKFGGSRKNSFIVTQDDNINLDRLEDLMKPSAVRERPAELFDTQCMRKSQR